MQKISKTTKKFILVIGALIVVGFLISILPTLFVDKYESEVLSAREEVDGVVNDEPPVFKASHLETPTPVKALYMTSWVAGRPDLRQRVVNIIDTTEANSIVIDIKDDTGRISFEVMDPELKAFGSEEIRIADLREFIEELHQKDIYVIGRISSFQDPYMVKLHPEWAVRRSSDGGVWKDRKGISWIDAGAKPMWDYLALVGKESYEAGFDELNYDYIRFPSDGNMQDISFSWSGTGAKSDVIKSYFSYITSKLRDTEYKSGDGPVISADLFGMTTTAQTGFDLGIGQIFEDAIYYFDYVGPMVYPSHYPTGFYGYKDPNTVPYEIIKIAMDGGVNKIKSLASTSPNYDYKKIRPWLQDFDYGGNYDVAEVRAQIKATYDAGLDSWMIWDPSNKYTTGAYLPE